MMGWRPAPPPRCRGAPRASDWNPEAMAARCSASSRLSAEDAPSAIPSWDKMTALLTCPTRRTRSSRSQSSCPPPPAGPGLMTMAVSLAWVRLLRRRVLGAGGGTRAIRHRLDGRERRDPRSVLGVRGVLRASLLPAALQGRHALADPRRPRPAGRPAPRPAAGHNGLPLRRISPQLGSQVGLLDPARQ